MAKIYKKYTLHLSVFLWLLFSVTAISSLGAQPRDDESPQTHSDADPILVKEYELDGRGTINVFTVSGDINLVSVPDTRVVRIELFSDRGFSFGSLFSSSDNYRIISFKRGSEITTSVEPKGKQSGYRGNPTTYSYKITVPESISTNLKTLSGSVSTQRVKGDQFLNSNGGNIRITNAAGMIKAYTSGGNINIMNSRGTIFARVDGGSVNADNVTGELRLKVQGGTISSSEISGSMVAVVNAGDIRAQFKKVVKGIDLQTNAGNIQLVVPPSNGYELHARGSDVRFDEGGTFRGTYSNERAEGSVNGGGIPINLTANAGRVTLQLKN
jgi:hypothetical protein